MRKPCSFLLVVMALAVVSCARKGEQAAAPVENLEAKKMLQGIWVDADDESVAFKVKGDTIYYPDTVSAPVFFQIMKDTLMMKGSQLNKYQILKQAAHLFEFKNTSGDIIKLVKSEDPQDNVLFEKRRVIPLNQGRVVKRDTLVDAKGDRYHCYMQVNPTTYKVYKSAYNNEGLVVDNVFYDNTVHVSIFKGGVKVYSHDFRKSEFAAQVPAGFLRQSILSDILLLDAGDKGFRFQAQLTMPDSYSNYLIDFVVGFKGNVTFEEAR